MLVTRILSAFFFIAAIGLSVVLVNNIKSKIDADKYIERQETMVINKLKMIRDAQVAFLSTNGRYTASFDTLIAFIDTGSLYITQRRDIIEQQEYGEEKVTILIDTIGKVGVYDSIFVIREPMLCLTEGTVRELNVTEGSQVKKDDVVATILSSKGKSLKVKALQTGTIEKIAVKEGEQVTAQKILANLAYPRTLDTKSLALIPESKNNAKFELFAGKIVRGNVTVDVFEAKDVEPVNPARKAKKNENALRVGSRTEVSVSGNWE
jgi:hypothetical protein